MNAKAQLYTQVLPEMKARGAYFSHKAIKAAAREAGLALKDATLNAYLSQAVKQGLIHDAGRGWYSRLSERAKLDGKPVSKLTRAVEKAFPLLEFTVWSTAQLNPWMHHLLAKPVAFLYAQRDTLESVGATLKELGWEVAVNPGRREGAGMVRPGEKMVVLRPAHSKQPSSPSHHAAVEQVLVELLVEAAQLGIMDESEAQRATDDLLGNQLVLISYMQMFADSKQFRISIKSAVH
jgi:hypothetical protein